MDFPAPTAIELVPRPGSPSITPSTHQLGSGPAVVLCHSFPDLAYGWPHQLTPIAEAGFHTILGHGRAPPGARDGRGRLVYALHGVSERRHAPRRRRRRAERQ
jgi:hypothetical protein